MTAQAGNGEERKAASQELLVLPAKGRLELARETSIATRREIARSRIAYSLVALLVVVFLSLVGLMGAHEIKVNDALAILAPLTAVVGTALGFYFGGQKDGL